MASDVAYANESFSDYETDRVRYLAQRATVAAHPSAAIADVVTLAVEFGDRGFRLEGVRATSIPGVRKITDQLNRFATLPVDWNSYGAPPAAEGSLESAADIAFHAFLDLGAEPQISPMSDGGITLLWQRGGGECEIEVVGGTASVLVDLPDQEEREYSNISVPGAKELLRNWLST